MNNNYKRIINRYKSSLFRLKNVIGIGYGKKERKNNPTADDAIIILVEKKVPIKQLERKDIVPLKLENNKTDVIEIGRIQFLNSRTEKMRPAQPGISIGHYKVSAGTLGAIVRDRKTGIPLILSNNHVLANRTNGKDARVEIGDPILQPGKYDNGNNPNDVIGHLERFIPIKINTDTPTCPRAQEIQELGNELLHLWRPDYELRFMKNNVENKVDCALAKPISTEVVDNNILEIGKINGIKQVESEMQVKKSGRTTGVTEGVVRVVDATIQVEMSENVTATFTDQFVTNSSISEAGDSGALVVDTNNNAVGLLFAGSDKATVCNKITNVMEELDIEFY